MGQCARNSARVQSVPISSLIGFSLFSSVKRSVLPTRSSRPPGATRSLAGSRSSGRPQRMRRTRSKVWSGRLSRQSMEGPSPYRASKSLPRSIASGSESVATTCQPVADRATASRPEPQPTSRALPMPPTCSTQGSGCHRRHRGRAAESSRVFGSRSLTSARRPRVRKWSATASAPSPAT